MASLTWTRRIITVLNDEDRWLNFSEVEKKLLEEFPEFSNEINKAGVVASKLGTLYKKNKILERRGKRRGYTYKLNEKGKTEGRKFLNGNLQPNDNTFIFEEGKEYILIGDDDEHEREKTPSREPFGQDDEVKFHQISQMKTTVQNNEKKRRKRKRGKKRKRTNDQRVQKDIQEHEPAKKKRKGNDQRVVHPLSAPQMGRRVFEEQTPSKREMFSQQQQQEKEEEEEMYEYGDISEDAGRVGIQGSQMLLSLNQRYFNNNNSNMDDDHNSSLLSIDMYNNKNTRIHHHNNENEKHLLPMHLDNNNDHHNEMDFFRNHTVNKKESSSTTNRRMMMMMKEKEEELKMSEKNKNDWGKYILFIAIGCAALFLLIILGLIIVFAFNVFVVQRRKTEEHHYHLYYTGNNNNNNEQQQKYYHSNTKEISSGLEGSQIMGMIEKEREDFCDSSIKMIEYFESIDLSGEQYKKIYEDCSELVSKHANEEKKEEEQWKMLKLKIFFTVLDKIVSLYKNKNQILG